jgi:hypothetical protein
MGDQDASLRATSALAASHRLSLKSGGHGDPRAMRKAAEEFEGQFLARMLEPMFDGIETDGPGGGGHLFRRVDARPVRRPRAGRLPGPRGLQAR